MRLRITQRRKALGLTVEALADAAGMSKSYLSEIERGVKPINARRLDALSKALRCSPIDLIDDDSVEPGLVDHLRRLQALSAEDRAAVLSHAEALARKAQEA